MLPCGCLGVEATAVGGDGARAPTGRERGHERATRMRGCVTGESIQGLAEICRRNGSARQRILVAPWSEELMSVFSAAEVRDSTSRDSFFFYSRRGGMGGLGRSAIVPVMIEVSLPALTGKRATVTLLGDTPSDNRDRERGFKRSPFLTALRCHRTIIGTVSPASSGHG